MEKGIRFVASYSGGKDSLLAIHRAVSQGMVLQALLITYNTNKGRSWFHGVPEDILGEVGKSIGVPVIPILTDGMDYVERFEETLRQQKALGAEACVFGDIDIDDHLQWGIDRCEAVGMKAVHPLWKESREALVRETIAAGFVPRLTVIDTESLGPEFLGRQLSFALMEEIEAAGADVCGENGEYHTFVTDGPVFSYPIPVKFGRMLMQGRFAVLPMDLS